MLTEVTTLDRYRLLGRSGLRVSPLALGAMTFGTDWGWGTDQDEAHRIFDTYVAHGGNLIDTANQYTNGTSEKFVGVFARGKRDRLVIATKYTLPTGDDPNSGGNSRKSMMRSVEASLRNLVTDYIDVLYLHAWDGTTGAEEITRAMDDLVRSGKVLYLGISNTPAWQIARMHTIADLRGQAPIVALQIEYNLVERTGERELIPMAQQMGLGVIAYSPLASGILAGRYDGKVRDTGGESHFNQGSRKELLLAGGRLSERALAIAAVVKEVAVQVGKSPAQVALAWTLENSAVTSPIIGARSVKQLHENIGALEVRLTESQRSQLSVASAVPLGFPHEYLTFLLKSSFMSACMNIDSEKEAS